MPSLQEPGNSLLAMVAVKSKFENYYDILLFVSVLINAAVANQMA